MFSMQNFDNSVPILTIPLISGAGDAADDVLQTRMGYKSYEVFRALELSLQDASATGMGKVIHYSADIICSGGFALWQRFCFEYALDHIGMASLRIFYYLKVRMRELKAEYDRLPSDQFYADQTIQKKIAEIMLVLQQSPRRGRPKMPTVPAEMHRNPAALIRRGPDSSAVARVWIRGSDTNELFFAGNELLYACTEGALERALYWLKWAIEEDAILKKANEGALTTATRGIHGKATPLHFFMAALAQAYSELSTRGTIRMNDEVQSLIDMYKSKEAGLTARRKLDIVVLLIQIICEVPKLRVPAASPVVKDPLPIQRATEQAPSLFAQILAKPEPKKVIKKVAAPKKVKKLSAVENKLSIVDDIFASYYNIDGPRKN